MKNFTKVPNEILRNVENGDLDCYDVAVYFAIFKHRNETTGKCYPSIRTISRILKIDTKTVMKRIVKLGECGIISYIKRVGVGTEYKSVGYAPTECRTSSYKTILKNKTINKEEKIDFKKRDKMINDVRKKYNIIRN